MILEDLFQDMAELRQMVPGLESNLTFGDLNASAITARKRITDLIGQELYGMIIAGQSTDADIFDARRIAIANFIARQHLVFDTIARRKDDIDVYKYELEEMERAYMDNYYNAMDTLMRLLCEQGSEQWEASRLRRMTVSLPLPEAALFDEFYPIDMSYLFFFRTVPMQREVYEQHLSGLFDKLSLKEPGTGGYDALRGRLLRVTAKWTVALALRRFDIIEFPAVIRNLFSDSKASRSGTTVQQRLLQMADSLVLECESETETLQMLMDSEQSDNISPRTSFNREDDLIILMP